MKSFVHTITTTASAIIIGGALSATYLFAQVDSAKNATSPSPTPPAITFNAYVDMYYAVDNDYSSDPNNATRRRRYRQAGFVNIIRDEFSLNTVQLTANLNLKNVRGKITLHYGSIAFTSQTLFSAESSVIQEANVGIQPVDNLWVDAGYFLTHIGNEVLVPKDNVFSSHTLVTTYEPFYQSGVRVAYTFSDKFEAHIHLLNGYGIVIDNNNNKSVSLFVAYKPMDFLTLSYASIYGNEQPRGTPAALRLYHNMNGTAQFGDLLIKGQVDFATQEALRNGGKDGGSFIGGQVTARYGIGKFGIAGRFEFFDDTDDLVLSGKLKGTGISLGLEYKPTENAFIRLEGRALSLDNSAIKPFQDTSGKVTGARTEAAVVFGVWF